MHSCPKETNSKDSAQLWQFLKRKECVRIGVDHWSRRLDSGSFSITCRMPDSLFRCYLAAWSMACRIAKGAVGARELRSVARSCPNLCNPMDCSAPGLPVHHQLLELIQTHVYRVSDAIHPLHPLSSSSSPAFNLSQNQGLSQWVSSLHQVAKALEFHLQH